MFDKHLERILYIIIGFLFGMILCKLYCHCFSTIRGPNSNIIKKKIYTINGEKFRLEPVPHLCPLTHYIFKK